MINDYKSFKEKEENIPANIADAETSNNIKSLQTKLENQKSEFTQIDNTRKKDTEIYRAKISKIEEDMNKLKTDMENTRNKLSKHYASLSNVETNIDATSTESVTHTLANHTREKEIDLLICMDSNITTLHHILINIGTNDIETKTANQVYKEITEIIDILKSKYPGIKIIICEVTPRADEKDDDVIICNRMLNEYAPRVDNLFIVNHSNLRDENYSLFSDTKHVKERCIPKLAKNIKIGLRQAYYGKQNENRYDRENKYRYTSRENLSDFNRMDNTKPQSNGNNAENSLKLKILDAFKQSMDSVFGG